jgi:hypothetical protein
MPLIPISEKAVLSDGTGFARQQGEEPIQSCEHAAAQALHLTRVRQLDPGAAISCGSGSSERK